MADVDVAPTFGTELKDGFKPANTWVAHGISWLDEIQQFYRERSAIEKEYAAKLNALAKKYFEKKNKKSAPLSVGDTPAMTPGSLESASLTTWSTQLTTLEARADEHDRYGNNLLSQVAEPLKFLGTRFEELRKRHADYAGKLEHERDSQYADLRKTKAKYDGACQEVESKRKKSESSFDKAKAQSAYQQQILDMNNVKNTYLIAINVTNKQKERYYHEYVPEVMDSLQDLSEFRTMKLNGLWTIASQLEAAMLQSSKGLMEKLGTEISRNQPHLDSMMYIRHNLGTFQEPADKTFEPSPVWHDDDQMVVDESAKIYLRNVLSKSKAQLGDLRREVDKKRREVEAIKRIKQRIREGTEKKDEVMVVTQIFALQEDLHAVDRRRVTAEVETSTITSAVGDVSLGAKNHNFKAQTFKIPTNCDLCGERIWGLSAKGFDCRDCGYTCHNKCEMKVPADCPGEQTKEERKKLKAERQEAANSLLRPTASSPTNASDSPTLTRSNTMNSLSSGYAHSARRSITGGPTSPIDEAPPEPSTPRPAAPASTVSSTTTRKRVMAPPPAAYISELPGSAPNGSSSSEQQKGKMLYTFEASGDGEVSVPEGREVTMLEPDDGSGWVKVRAGYKEGIVPASYVDWTVAPASPMVAQNTGASARPESTYSNSGSSIGTAGAGKKKGPAVAPRRGAKKLKYVEALYEYTAQSDAEHSMAEGERFVLIKDDPGDGWAEVEKGGVTKSVPASYVQAV
ncbi:Actin polymerization protein [Colletotrichum higginsianum IMI 349063]|uniref:Protein BZZ1 n=4 Tax=Colletotrichum higginsianum TaxID=80884 RepID=A0A1B7Y5T6_COLHI|nr:Actin polymerization protein [Colletotrichum higginsianum IMI 349063]OBR07411.1 Actin polymerization protein [Colletotrichum higginsianum IMI 349063]TIC92470.1 Protein BZZ1 [Colletotrichum higginsianum]GJC98470.1 actin polymerization protein [Colletotrichum higginsianum]